MSSEPSPAAPPWSAMLRGMRANVVPGLILQVAALALVLAYYRHAPTRALLGRVAEFRAETGMWFGIVSTGMVGGVIPLLYLWSQGATRARYTLGQGVGLIAFWSYKGAEVEFLYRWLARLVGEGVDLGTIATKMSIDQFVYCPLFAVPVTVLIYALVDAHFRAGPVQADLRAPRWYRRRVVPVLIPNLVVWIPAVGIIYALPTPLQLPLQNVVLCFFTLLLAHVTKDSASPPQAAKKR